MRDIPARLLFRKRFVSQYELNGKYVKTYDSIAEAANAIDGSAKQLYLCLRGEKKSLGGYIWRKGKNKDRLDTELYEMLQRNKLLNAKKIVSQYTKTGEYIKTYESIANAAKQTGISKATIGQAANRKLKSSGGFIWRFGSSTETLDLSDLKHAPFATSNRSVSQYDLNGSLLASYTSIKGASLKTGVSRSNIDACLRGRSRHAGGFVWKYQNPDQDKN